MAWGTVCDRDMLSDGQRKILPINSAVSIEAPACVGQPQPPNGLHQPQLDGRAPAERERALADSTPEDRPESSCRLHAVLARFRVRLTMQFAGIYLH